MTIQPLINKFRARINNDKSNMQTFIKLVRAVASYDKARGWLTPLASLPSDEQIAATLKAGSSAPKAASPPS